MLHQQPCASDIIATNLRRARQALVLGHDASHLRQMRRIHGSHLGHARRRPIASGRLSVDAFHLQQTWTQRRIGRRRNLGCARCLGTRPGLPLRTVEGFGTRAFGQRGSQ
ncbi:hypothetical protein M0D46_11510 [Xanthomonas prunicola]|uniref:hypothetical protein n=1 Tax=Xanthomonas prunicola TaxID=2053930 RepID=UPI0021B18354|nr:hypothetical protein [Xanthomonas prunicola]UXA67786.1 hypothetical protein M0D46_11510 [Xanthomonas prunicola]